jgi:hypothetical protein
VLCLRFNNMLISELCVSSSASQARGCLILREHLQLEQEHGNTIQQWIDNAGDY